MGVPNISSKCYSKRMINELKRRSLAILIVMIFFLPFWITIGKGMVFGVIGWVAIISLFTVAPALLVTLVIFYILLRTRRDVRSSKHVGAFDAFLLIALYVTIFLGSIFTVDGGDTKESINSVATKFGMDEQTNDILAVIFVLSTTLIFLACFVVFIYEAVKKRAITRVPQSKRKQK